MDISLFENIDFKSQDNLFFIVISFIIIIIVLAIFLIILFKSLKIVKKITSRIFNGRGKNPKFNKNISISKPVESSPLAEGEENHSQLKKQNIGESFGGNISNEKKESEKDKKVGDADNKLPKFSHSEDSKGSSVTLKQKIMGGGAMTKIIGGDNKSKEKNAGPSYRDKEAKNISEHLAKLKSNPDDKKDTLASKMPSRAEDDEKDTDRDLLRSSTSMVFLTKSAQEKSRAERSHNDKNTNNNSFDNKSIPGGKQKSAESVTKSGLLKAPLKSNGSSIFEDDGEVSKMKLEHEMRTDSKIWQASRQSGLNLSPVERSKLVEKVFSKAQGRSISKTDLKSSIRKLNQKMLNTKDSEEHAKLRKEIKFFKKIGGIR
jgi:hypothetical protein